MSMATSDPAPNDIGAYQRLHKLGEGTYGVVFKAREKATGKIVALKKIKLENEENGMPSTSLREITVLKELRHPNIVQLYTIVYQDKHNLQLVFEFLDYDLKKHMENATEGMPAEVVRSYMYQLLSGMRYCHARRIIHRDLKPQNLLIDANGTLKIADFGLARCFGVPLRNYTHEVVTLWYRSPEVLLGCKTYGIGLDMWSIGCIFGEMAIHNAMFPGDSEIDQLFKIFQVLGTPDEQIWPGVHDLPDYKPHFPKWPKSSLELYADKLGTAGVDLLDGLLTYFPGQRTSAARALQHPYFEGLDKSMYEM
ncbi:cyclin dependent kinase-like protein 2 [Catenaria anguillulae PL171]|uniref:Cyclin-dependent kinase 1 n=1 Tax=Catenaria anguillulae PL171 TaxID=765915 RepID=A0A1Y2H8I0_9FUNG|nr:cyclin dependent kinase-like protein 2 [Catenaria anguillulae PL171]